MGVVYSEGRIFGDTLKGLGERLAQGRAGRMVLHLAGKAGAVAGLKGEHVRTLYREGATGHLLRSL